jgi:hypothetical protein
MAVQVKIELHPDAIKNLLRTDQGIHDDLESRGEKVRDSANQKTGDEFDHESAVYVGFDRQRAVVRTASQEARVEEAENHTLLSSLDAARSP